MKVHESPHDGVPPAADPDALQALLDAVPAPLEALDVTALDGFLVGVALQPEPPAPERWLRWVTDVEGRALPPGAEPPGLHQLVLRRRAELEHAITRRDWFDPWIYELDGTAGVSESVLPWVAGFAAAQDLFPTLQQLGDPALLEPLALLYMHVAPDDLEDADSLIELIDTLEPPADLAEAVQDLVRAVMLIADVSRPRKPAPQRRRRR